MAQISDLTRPTVAPVPELLDQLDAGRQGARRRFVLVFALTWIAVIGGLGAVFFYLDKIDPQFIWTWAPYILGGVPVTIIICVCSIALAIVLAALGALGRLSRNPVIYAIASLYVSLVRGTPLIVQIIFIYLALAQLGVVIP